MAAPTQRWSAVATAALLFVAAVCAGFARAEDAKLAPLRETPDAFLTTPAAGYRWEVPVLVLSYLPTHDGVNVAEDIAGCRMSLADLRQRIMALTVRTKFILEEGSRFHAYKDAQAKPSLGYRILDMITVFEPIPGDMKHGDRGAYPPDYHQVLNRWDIAKYVEQRGVKEVWIWMQHHGDRGPIESNMASPLTGDISNSWRIPDDMPILKKTYVVYCYNFTRDARCSVEDHMHQLEAQLDYVSERQTGNADLFRKAFVGIPVLGRCGNVHCPPNTAKDYDVANPALVMSDIEDWTPTDTGGRTAVSCATWTGKTYPWPDGKARFDEWEGSYWFIYWQQNHPGRGNLIRHPQGWITNWWAFVGDWDGSIRSHLGLFAPQPDPG
jgi:hypothetical protein